MEPEKRKEMGKTPLKISEVTTCKATAQMLEKAERDGVETAFHRAADMKACPIGADSACCKHCAMGPCRLSSKDPYGKVGVCGATIDTIMSRNFARMVASGTAAHTDHGLSMLELFRDVVDG
ncbi:MAG: carbon monoxide dehydrogenase, partial [Desulfobacterota bacterium]|nr:carbon monoxide dehydrogenase [Thermodesulfobacteriota bacterium]